jgi:hypothetical protein
LGGSTVVWDWWYESASSGVGRVRTDRWDSRAAEREVTRDAEDPRPVLLVLVIAFGRGENGGRVVFVYPLAREAEGRESTLEYEVRRCILEIE